MELIWDYVVPFLIILTPLVFVHELGHFLVARRYGVKVEVFSIGFGPEIFGWTDKTGTRWKFSAVPLGGYVKMFGEYDFDDELEDGQAPMTEEQKEVSYHHKRVGQRAAIAVAGPIANFLFAIAVLAVLFSTAGVPAYLSAVGSIQEGSAAEEAGFEKGDLILSIDGEPIALFDDLRRIVSGKADVPLSFIVLRGNTEATLSATPKRVMRGGEAKEIGLLGIKPDVAQLGYERQNPLTATWMATERSVAMTVRILSAVGQIITGEMDADELGGPLRIAQVSGEAAAGGIISLVFFMAALSVNLGLINLFPIPVLDGGHLMFYAAEALRGRPLDARYQEYGFRFGLILVLLLMIFATWNDLVNLKVFEFLKQLAT